MAFFIKAIASIENWSGTADVVSIGGIGNGGKSDNIARGGCCSSIVWSWIGCAYRSVAPKCRSTRGAENMKI